MFDYAYFRFGLRLSGWILGRVQGNRPGPGYERRKSRSGETLHLKRRNLSGASSGCLLRRKLTFNASPEIPHILLGRGYRHVCGVIQQFVLGDFSVIEGFCILNCDLIYFSRTADFQNSIELSRTPKAQISRETRSKSTLDSFFRLYARRVIWYKVSRLSMNRWDAVRR